MFLDVLGTITAFVSIIALLSVLVTTLVQVAQAVLRLRARNLQMCLAGLIMEVRGQEPSRGLNWLRGEALKAKREAAILLNQPASSPLQQVKKPTSFWHYYISGPKVSWVEPEQLEKALGTAKLENKLSDEQKKTLVSEFKDSTEHLKKRFLLICRLYTVAISAVVAVAFQASTPEIFNNLSMQAAGRQEFLAKISPLIAQSEENLKENGTDELTLDALLNNVDSDRAALAGVGFELWADNHFYRKTGKLQWRHILGVLMTTALLSLGAPFWFELLRNTINFRDLLARKAGTSNDPKNNN
jgi:hypothetical protein